MIESWNISNYMGNKNTLNCINNGLKRNNERMKSLFNAGTPSFADFVNTMREEYELQQPKVDEHMNKTAVKEIKLTAMIIFFLRFQSNAEAVRMYVDISDQWCSNF